MQQEPQYSVLPNKPLDECEIEMPNIIPPQLNGVYPQQVEVQIPFQPVNQTTVVVNNVQQQQTLDQLVQSYVNNLNIQNHFSFVHNYTGKYPCLCGTIHEWSRISVEPSLGQLDTGYDGCYCCCVPCLCCIRWCIRCAILLNQRRADYRAQNPKTSLEYWQNGMGRVKIKGIPVLDFVQTHPNCWDALCGHCLSSYPKLEVYSAFGNPPTRIVIYPDRSYLPETIFTILAPFAPFGMFIWSRQFTVQGLTRGTCKITNTRNCLQACSKIYLVQGCCCLPEVDYPNFEIEFSNDVPQLDRLAVVMGLIHYTIFKKWYFMTVVKENISGIA